jgi:5-formyltetrahydrofolate cyclo-ligase
MPSMEHSDQPPPRRTPGEIAAEQTAAAKADLRARLLSARAAALDTDRRAADATGLCRQVMALPELATADTVAAYTSIGSEPPTGELLPALRAAGLRVLLPVLRPDSDLDWAAYTGPASLSRGPRGLREPAGPRLGREAVARAQVILVPALAVDVRGVRLGRGGGSYDRALARVPAGWFIAALLYDGEVLRQVPAEPYDRPVTAAVTPTQLHRFPVDR